MVYFTVFAVKFFTDFFLTPGTGGRFGIAYCFLLSALFSPGNLYSQCPASNTVFGDGEQIRYSVSYNWGPVWVDAGLVTFTVTKEHASEMPLWHLKATGTTYSSYDLLFKVRDYYDSWIDSGTFNMHHFKRYIYEGGYSLLNTMQFDHPGKMVISNTKTNNNPQRTDTIPMRPCTFDMLSAIYYIRTLNFPELLTAGKKNVTVLIDDGYYDINVRAIGRETVESKDGKRYRCIKFAARMVQGTIFKGDEDVLVWVTDDANKIPIYIEAKIIVGTVKAYLKDAKGLRNPFSAIVR